MYADKPTENQCERTGQLQLVLASSLTTLTLPALLARRRLSCVLFHFCHFSSPHPLPWCARSSLHVPLCFGHPKLAGLVWSSCLGVLAERPCKRAWTSSPAPGEDPGEPTRRLQTPGASGSLQRSPHTDLCRLLPPLSSRSSQGPTAEKEVSSPCPKLSLPAPS